MTTSILTRLDVLHEQARALAADLEAEYPVGAHVEVLLRPSDWSWRSAVVVGHKIAVAAEGAAARVVVNISDPGPDRSLYQDRNVDIRDVRRA